MTEHQSVEDRLRRTLRAIAGQPIPPAPPAFDPHTSSTRHSFRISGVAVAVAAVAAAVSLALLFGPHSGNGAGEAHKTTPATRPTPATVAHPSTTTIPTTTPLEPIPTAGVLLNRPQAMAILSNGNVLISNEGSNQVLERLPNGSLTSLAGNGQAGFGGDGGPASAAELDDPQGLAVSSGGTVYVADSGNNRIRTITPTGTISTLAQVQEPTALAIGPSNDLYVVDVAGVQSVAPSGAVATLIPATSGGDGRVVNELSIGGTSFAFFPSAIAVSASGVIYIDNSSPKLLLADSDGTMSLVGQTSVLQGGTYVTVAGLEAAPDGDIYVSDYGGSIDRVRGNTITPVVIFTANSVAGLDGFIPSGVAVGTGGEIYTDTDGVNGGSNRPALVSIDPDGRVHLLDVGTVSP